MPFVIFGLLLLVSVVVGKEVKIQSMPPSIVPAGGIFLGGVPEGVAILSNARERETSLYYTITVCAPSLENCQMVEPDPENVGLDKPTKQLQKGERILIHRPGQTWVSAMAVTNGQIPSTAASAKFEITRLEITSSIPQIHTPTEANIYRSQVQIYITAPEDTTVHYTVDGDMPGLKSPVYKGPFVVDTPGVHFIRALGVNKKGEISPSEQRKIEIYLPVAYQVSTSGCPGCKGPTVGIPFTLMFQGFKVSPLVRIFVSTVDCTAGPIHPLVGFNEDKEDGEGVIPHKQSITILTTDAPNDNIYVCYSHNGGQTWEKIPRASDDPAAELVYPFKLYPSPTQASPVTASQNSIGAVVEEAPFDWAEYNKQKRTERANNEFDPMPVVVIVVILGTGFFMMMKGR
eukprot:TRINITY_DN1338_c0_g1_i7.p1 TRINITY_DN1338_c0_g1~~TRINITY_DN1338_c0_g1_i7.p1  ORF type:complete len:402 (+),score=81.21 TRINITY_DN1338_c0_g1_i7:101-1306(+)